MVFQERTYSVLIVSSSDSFATKIMPLLPVTDYWPVTTVHSIGEARRKIAEAAFDIVLINAPLPDDFGMRLAVDICTGSGAGVLLLVRNDQFDDIYAKVVSYGVLTLSKPTNMQMVAQNLRILCATRERMRQMGGKAGHSGGEDRGDPSGQPGQVAVDRVPRHDRAGGPPLYRKAIHGSAHLQAGGRRSGHQNL